MADLPSGDGTADSAHMANLALDLADQLINAFQQEADGTGDGAGEATHDDGILPSDNGALDSETEAKDGNDEWQELAREEEEFSEGYDNGVKGEGVGEENPGSLFSPLGSHDDCVADSEAADTRSDVANVDVEFNPAKVLNFDDSDGDDLPAVDQRFIPRGVFVQSDFLDDRPELHGSEEADYFTGPSRTNAMQGDHSQNVRIIEGHDDLDFDRGAGYMSLARRNNNFLQTQMVQLPPLTAEDHNLSGNLYDSLEREEEEFYAEEEEEEQEHEDDEDDTGHSGRDYANGEDGSDPRDVRSAYPDRRFAHEDPPPAGYLYHGQHLPRAMERGDHHHHHHHHHHHQGNGGSDEEGAGAAAKSPSRNAHSALNHVSPHGREPEQRLPLKHDGQKAESQSQAQQPAAKDETLGGRGSAVVVTLPKPSGSGTNLVQGGAGGIGGEQARGAENPEQMSARPKQPVNKSQPRGGPAGSNVAEAGSAAGSKPQQRLTLNRADQRAGVTGGNNSSNRARGRAGVGSARQVGGGTQTQRPAVQGAAGVAGVGGGDGDGAVAGLSARGQGQGQGQGVAGAAGPMLSSRTSSQGSIHSNASNNSTSRVGGVGKESNSNRYNQPRSAKAYPAPRPGNQYSAGNCECNCKAVLNSTVSVVYLSLTHNQPHSAKAYPASRPGNQYSAGNCECN